jgi:hypothetical protein
MRNGMLYRGAAARMPSAVGGTIPVNGEEPMSLQRRFTLIWIKAAQPLTPPRLSMLRATVCKVLVVLTHWAELDHLAVLLDDHVVPRRQVVSLARREHLLAIGIQDPQPSFQHHAPMRALAAIVREFFDQCLSW